MSVHVFVGRVIVCLGMDWDYYAISISCKKSMSCQNLGQGYCSLVKNLVLYIAPKSPSKNLHDQGQSRTS